jgi:hypothetical protein
MAHSALIILIGLIWILPFFEMPLAQEVAPLLTIDFSLDLKNDSEFGHTVIQYSLTKEGHEFDVRNVYDWAAQAGHQRELPKGIVDKITNLLRGLPDPAEKNIPKDWLVIVTFRDESKIRVSEYHRKKLPPSLKEVLELLGGIRFELKDTIVFPATGI